MSQFFCNCCGEKPKDEDVEVFSSDHEIAFVGGDESDGGLHHALLDGSEQLIETGTPKGIGTTLIGEEGRECNFYVNKRGIQLWEQKFQQPNTIVKGAVLFLHGIAEHSSRYNHVLEALSKQGIVCYTFDAMGHGRSEDLRGRVSCDSFDEFVDDAEEFLERIRTEHPENIPIFLFGQSFGGLVSCFLALRDTKRVKGVILASPAIGVEMSLTLRVQAKAAKVASSLTPDLPIVPVVDPNDMSKCPKAVKEYVDDPLNTVGPLRCRVASETLQAFKILAKKHEEFDVEHMLVLFGDTDRCCSLPKAKEFVENVPVKNKKMKVFPNMYHTLFHEPEKDTVIQYLLDWIDPLV